MPEWTGLSDARNYWTFSCQNGLDFLMPETTGLSAARVPAKRSGLDLATKTPPPPSTSSFSLPPSTYQRLSGRTLAAAYMGGSHNAHCTLCTVLVLCMAQYSPPPPPPVPLGQDGGDLLLAASFTVTHQGSASSQIQASIVFETGFW